MSRQYIDDVGATGDHNHFNDDQNGHHGDFLFSMQFENFQEKEHFFVLESASQMFCVNLDINCMDYNILISSWLLQNAN